jgi:peptidoglycan/xylan/chitin deacetylase (PgdA/CDA1 family)
VRGNTSVPAIALTFDAGAGAGPTQEILAALAARGLRATFFLTGKWADENPDLARQISASGHEIANHSYNHPDFTTLSHARMVEEINSTERAIVRLTGQSTRPWFRFPYGARNAATLGVIADLEYVSIYWTLDSLDSVGQPKTPRFLWERVTGNVGNGSIVLMHIGSAPTAAALPSIIDTLQARGYQLVTVSELLRG